MTDEDPSQSTDTDSPGPALLDPLGQFLSFRRDVLVLSLAMFGFSLGFQMTTRYLPEYLNVLGAGAIAIGLFGTIHHLISAAYPYPGGAISDRLGSRRALTLFGIISSGGFLLWLLAPLLGAVSLAGWSIDPWIWVIIGLFFAQAWKSLGLGATFAIVKQSVPPAQLARGFASTEVVRRLAFLVGPLLAAGLLFVATDFQTGFQAILAVALAVAIVATIVQHVLYRAADTVIGSSFDGLHEIVADLRGLPPELRPLLVADILVRFGNGMVYVFFVIVVVNELGVGLDIGAVALDPAVFFGLLLGVEMVVALISMPIAARAAERVGLKTVVTFGFSVYALFPLLLISSPENALVLAVLFAYSGLRFAGLPAHKALIVGPADRDTGGRVTGSYYLVRNLVVIPSAAIGGALYGGVSVPGTGVSISGSPTLAFTLATIIGTIGTIYFLIFGREFAAYA